MWPWGFVTAVHGDGERTSAVLLTPSFGIMSLHFNVDVTANRGMPNPVHARTQGL